MKKALLTGMFAGLAILNGWAQRNCGHEAYIHNLDSVHPGFKAAFKEGKAKALEAGQAYRKTKDAIGPLSKTTASGTLIPVVFHFILDARQMTDIGDIAGIEDRIKTQLKVLNDDYNASNADAINIPAVWKSRYANMKVSFGLAHTDPGGIATPGYEIRTVGATASFSFFDACKAAKKWSSGGLDPWDNTRYLNIWVVNIEGGVLGITAPPGAAAGFPDAEKGIALNYLAFGARTSPGQKFIANIDQGRTMTHEMGHYFYLWHTWGDDGGLCPGDPGGDDDGIADTPPESKATYGNPTYPRYDTCSNASTNGIMFMNFLDYTNDISMYMFTNGQADVVNGQLAVGENSYSLTLHPELTEYPPVAITDPANGPVAVTVSPNPAHNTVQITYDAMNQQLLRVDIINMIGQVVSRVSQPAAGTLDVSALPRGNYLLQCQFEKGIVNKKIVVE